MRKYYQRIVLLLVATYGILHTMAQPVLQWKADYKEAIFQGFNPTHIQVDSQSNVIVAGAASKDNSSRYITVKYNKDGKRLWITTTGPFNGNDGVSNLWVSPSGSIYLAGASALVKLDAAGREQWRREGGYFVTDKEHNLFLNAGGRITRYDTSGNRIWEFIQPQDKPFNRMVAGGTGNLYFTSGNLLMMHDENGKLKWELPLVFEGDVSSHLFDIEPDNRGNIFLSFLRIRPYNGQFIVPYDALYDFDYRSLIKVNEYGEKEWEKNELLSYFDKFDLALQSNEMQTFVVNSNENIWVYDTSGNEQWSIGEFYNSSPKKPIAISKKGELYTLARFTTDNYEKWRLRKYAPDGTMLWSHWDNAIQEIAQMVCNDAGAIYITSKIGNDPVIIKYQDQEAFRPITFSLIDARKDTVIKTLSEGDTINLAANPYLNIQANTNDTVTRSVRMILNQEWWQGTGVLENNAPYALFGNRGSNFYIWKPNAGDYRLKAKSYTGRNGTGSESFESTIGFYVLFPQAEYLEVIDAKTGKVIQNIWDESTFLSSELPAPVNFRVRIEPEQYIGSVRMVLNNWSRVENHAPFTMAGNIGERYRGFELKPGQYTITVIPYSKDSAKGYTYNPRTFRFTVVDDTAPAVITGNNKAPELTTTKAIITAIPNPFSSQTAITFTATASGYTTLRVYDMSGAMVQQLFAGNAEKGRPYTIQMSKGTLKPSMYTLQLVTGNELHTQKVVITY